MVFTLSCFVFTKWGPGEGAFTEELVLVYPGGREDPKRGEVQITLPGGFRFAQVRHKVSVLLRQEGIYKWRLYLDGEYMQEHPFRVHIIKQVSQPEAERERGNPL